jgi:ArsR family transcriptional regulator
MEQSTWTRGSAHAHNVGADGAHGERTVDISSLIDTFQRMPTAPALDLTRTATLCHALSDQTRLAVLELLRDGERCVCELQEALDAAQSRLSFHLRVLREAGLVTDRREGRWSYYTLNQDALAELHDVVRALGSEPSSGGRTLRVFGPCCG